MSDFYDIAKRNPQGAMSVISSFGYEILDRSNLGRSLDELVANEGEPALIKVMDIHPDKDIILELFGNKQQKETFSENSTNNNQCGCGNCNRKNRVEQFANASGSEVLASKSSLNENSQSNIMANQTNIILVVATLFVTAALLMHKKI